MKLRTKLKLLKRDFFLSFKREKENKFDYIFSLGYNCEAAFRLYEYFKFEESSIFNWTFASSVNDLIFALNNFDKIGQDGYENPDPLWECKYTHIRFHGKADMSLYVNSEATDEIIENDKKDLIGRISHLKSKFLKLAKDNCKKLYVYKLRTDEINEEKINNIYSALLNLGAKNFKLLIITEKSAKFDTDDSGNIIFRQVDYFAPDDDVTSKKYFDNGFDKIWDEFYCANNKKEKNKKYKFETIQDET